MIDKTIVQQSVSSNAGWLGIAAPDVEYFPAGCFATPTTRAAAAQSGNGIAINEDMPWSELDVWWAVSHELRHVWQQRSAAWLLDGYRVSDGRLTDYNSQAAEIDAHAWAQLVMVSRFGVKPQLAEILGADLAALVDRRAAEIAEEMTQ